MGAEAIDIASAFFRPMFDIHEHNLGGIVGHRILDTATGQSLHILTGCGASLQSLVLKTAATELQELIVGYADEEDCLRTAGTDYRGCFLFPFPNRLAGGRYEWQGHEYQFEMNDGGRPNALHGLWPTAAFQYRSSTVGEDFGTLVIGKTIGSAESGAYPFDMDVQLEFTLSANKGLAVVVQVHNLGKTDAPFGVGYHPYFAAPKGLENYKFAMPPCLEYEVDGNLVPTGIQRQNFAFAEGAKVDMALDEGFSFGPDLPIVLAQLTDSEAETTVTMWQMAGSTGMRYLQIYTPPTRDRIAIEPMSCPANAMQTGEGLRTLAPGQAAAFSFGVRLDRFSPA